MKIKRFIVFLMMLAVILSNSATAIDFTKTGTLMIVTEYGSSPLVGMEIEIFLIATAADNGSGGVAYTPVPSFALALQLNGQYDPHFMSAAENAHVNPQWCWKKCVG